MSRYNISGSEGEYQQGSDERVLRNLAGIVDPIDMNIAEAELLEALYMQVFEDFPERLAFQTISKWHHAWLGNLYSWAGQFRTVDMSKLDISFASPLQLERLSENFESQYLTHFNELADMSDDKLVEFLAEVHVEFILIHPFREGNGRISRLLLDVIAVKAGAQPLDYTLWDQHKDFYFKSIQAGRDGDYQYIQRLVRDVLECQ